MAKAAAPYRHPQLQALVHGCGYKLANDGQDTRAIQHYFGHRSIASTVRYTQLAPDRSRGSGRTEKAT